MSLQYLLILSLSSFATVNCCLPKWQRTDKTAVKCKTALDCPQKEPFVCHNGICIDYNTINRRKSGKSDVKVTKICSTFLDCSPGLMCRSGRCVRR